MKHNVFAIYDNKVGAYSMPFYSQTNGSALRAFADHCNEKDSPPNKHPDDYSLHFLGTFDDQDGKLETGNQTLLGRAAEYVNAKP